MVVDMRAESRRVAEDRLELGGDRGVIGADEGGRGERRRVGNGEKLNDERERNDERRQRRAERCSYLRCSAALDVSFFGRRRATPISRKPCAETCPAPR